MREDSPHEPLGIGLSGKGFEIWTRATRGEAANDQREPAEHLRKLPGGVQ